jgi:hypothetical protein
MMGRSGRAALLLAPLAVASCASAPPAPAPAPVVAGHGVIIAIRPLDLPASAAVRASILAAVGAAASAAPGPAVVEFIIREDDGRTVSGMQANDGAFVANERVGLIGGPHVRMSALGS